MNVELRENGDVILRAGDASLCVRHGKAADGRERWDVCAGNTSARRLEEANVYVAEGGVLRQVGGGKRFALVVKHGG